VLGTSVGQYRIVGKLGVGGMGIVYEAEDTRLSRPVALKFLADELADDPDAVRRFKREAQTVALLNHPNICTIYDIGEDEGTTYIAMERCEGVNLKTHLARKTLGDQEIVSVARQVAEALGAAHDKGVVHRDIKPGNIIVGESGRVKVLDFGLARRFRVEAADGLGLQGSTIPGRPLGTANYMAPERILQLPLDPRSDLFSLGVVTYEMATGRLPFAGASPSETVANILEKDAPPLRLLSPRRPGSLEAIVHRLIAKQAAERFQSAAELTTALAAVTSGSGLWKRLFG
jgi:serine/threonine protein kinase